MLILVLLVAVVGCGGGDSSNEETGSDDLSPVDEPGAQGLGEGVVICSLISDDPADGSQLTSYSVDTAEPTGSVELTPDFFSLDSGQVAAPSYLGYSDVISLKTCDFENEVLDGSVPPDHSLPSATVLLGSTLDLDHQLMAATTTDIEQSAVGVIDLRSGEFQELSRLDDVSEDQFATTDVRNYPPTFDEETGDLVWRTAAGGEIAIMRAPTDGSSQAVEVGAEVSVNVDIFSSGGILSDQPIVRQPGGDVTLCCPIGYFDDGGPGYLDSVCEIEQGDVDWSLQTRESFPAGCAPLSMGGIGDAVDIVGWLSNGNLVDTSLNELAYSPETVEGGANVRLVRSLVPDTAREVAGVAVSPAGDSVLMIADGEFWIVSVTGGEPRRLEGVPIGQVVGWTDPEGTTASPTTTPPPPATEPAEVDARCVPVVPSQELPAVWAVLRSESTPGMGDLSDWILASATGGLWNGPLNPDGSVDLERVFPINPQASAESDLGDGQLAVEYATAVGSNEDIQSLVTASAVATECAQARPDG